MLSRFLRIRVAETFFVNRKVFLALFFYQGKILKPNIQSNNGASIKQGQLHMRASHWYNLVTGKCSLSVKLTAIHIKQANVRENIWTFSQDQ